MDLASSTVIGNNVVANVNSFRTGNQFSMRKKSDILIPIDFFHLQCWWVHAHLPRLSISTFLLHLFLLESPYSDYYYSPHFCCCRFPFAVEVTTFFSGFEFVELSAKPIIVTIQLDGFDEQFQSIINTLIQVFNSHRNDPKSHCRYSNALVPFPCSASLVKGGITNYITKTQSVMHNMLM